ncbi:hypothetical protein BDZ45DRAFT_750960 [Acephala macrosclerotiorum]|nr:hypothetical protein BDZ45DRAFT_750960 [Acephala macrosclerotiorum]
MADDEAARHTRPSVAVCSQSPAVIAVVVVLVSPPLDYLPDYLTTYLRTLPSSTHQDGPCSSLRPPAATLAHLISVTVLHQVPKKHWVDWGCQSSKVISRRSQPSTSLKLPALISYYLFFLSLHSWTWSPSAVNVNVSTQSLVLLLDARQLRTSFLFVSPISYGIRAALGFLSWIRLEVEDTRSCQDQSFGNLGKSKRKAESTSISLRQPELRPSTFRITFELPIYICSNLHLHGRNNIRPIPSFSDSNAGQRTKTRDIRHKHTPQRRLIPSTYSASPSLQGLAVGRIEPPRSLGLPTVSPTEGSIKSLLSASQQLD